MSTAFHPDVPRCRCEIEAAPYAQGRLAPDAAAAFARHLESCADCRQAVSEAEALFARLARWTLPDTGPDLVESVMVRVRAERETLFSRVRRAWPATLAVAAVLAAALGVTCWTTALGRSADPRQQAERRAAGWLVAAQRDDGSWGAPGRSGAGYRQALTGLGLLAGLEWPRTTALERACDRAAERLMRDQHADDGRIGPLFSGTPYNQGIATLALLAWCEAHPGAARPPAVERAVQYIVAAQDGSGGWGYAEGDPEPNVSITIWQVQALHRAVGLGLTEAEPALRRGLRWLKSVRNAEGLYGYRRPDDFPEGPDTLTAMGLYGELAGDPRAADRPEIRQSLRHLTSDPAAVERPSSYYAAYFLTRVLQQAAGVEGMETLLAQVQQTLLARQVRGGAQQGSWDLEDAYAPIGGPVYTTAMAALALHD